MNGKDDNDMTPYFAGQMTGHGGTTYNGIMGAAQYRPPKPISFPASEPSRQEVAAPLGASTHVPTRPSTPQPDYVDRVALLGQLRDLGNKVGKAPWQLCLATSILFAGASLFFSLPLPLWLSLGLASLVGSQTYQILGRMLCASAIGLALLALWLEGVLRFLIGLSAIFAVYLLFHLLLRVFAGG
ncbi:MAG: hypothetical protein ACFCU3_07020 [Verrucomicrobiales bacterium]